MALLKNKNASTLTRLACFTAILGLVFMIVGDLHAHRCFDGQEPVISFHFENLEGHPDHSEDEFDHHDDEYEVDTLTLLSKLKGLSQNFLVNSSPSVLLSENQLFHFNASDFRPLVKSAPNIVLPPLRAPPYFA